MNKLGCAFDESVPIHLFDGAEVDALLVGATALTLELTGNRRIHLDYQGCIEEHGTWLCLLPLCGEDSLMGLCGQSIRIEFASADKAFIHFSGGNTLDLLRDDPGADLVRFCIGKDIYQA